MELYIKSKKCEAVSHINPGGCGYPNSEYTTDTSHPTDMKHGHVDTTKYRS